MPPVKSISIKSNDDAHAGRTGDLEQKEETAKENQAQGACWPVILCTAKSIENQGSGSDLILPEFSACPLFSAGQQAALADCAEVLDVVLIKKSSREASCGASSVLRGTYAKFEGLPNPDEN